MHSASNQVSQSKKILTIAFCRITIVLDVTVQHQGASMREPSLAEQRTEKKRVQIRAAAKELFLQSGFQRTSMDAILAASGIASKDTLYRYYARKEDLFVDVVRSLTTEHLHLTQWTERSREPTSTQELRMLLRAIAQDVLETMVQPEYLAVFRLMLAELPRFPELGPLFRQTVPEPAINALLTLLRYGQANGVVGQHIDLPTIGRMFFGTLLTYGVLDGLLLNAQAPQMPEASVIDAFVEYMMEVVSAKGNR
jgi:TetR/AcrR family transcriptional regulator, mexJK operon transcriptional repressor